MIDTVVGLFPLLMALALGAGFGVLAGWLLHGDATARAQAAAWQQGWHEREDVERLK